ncbi:MAG: hypothetical protein ACYTFW_22950, partial [Planctomycetota bacterium]
NKTHANAAKHKSTRCTNNDRFENCGFIHDLRFVVELKMRHPVTTIVTGAGVSSTGKTSCNY